MFKFFMRGCVRWTAAIAIVGVCSITLPGCSDAPVAKRALEGAGYKNIILTGWGPFAGCSENDTFVTRFTAIGPTGIPVAGVVCSGWFKGATIRTY